MHIAPAIAITPPSLLGTERRIAYPNRKYHSGLMCVGVTNWLAIIKFSASIKIVGQYMQTATKPHNKNTTPSKSLKEKKRAETNFIKIAFNT